MTLRVLVFGQLTVITPHYNNVGNEKYSTPQKSVILSFLFQDSFTNNFRYMRKEYLHQFGCCFHQCSCPKKKLAVSLWACQAKLGLDQLSGFVHEVVLKTYYSFAKTSAIKLTKPFYKHVLL